MAKAESKAIEKMGVSPRDMWIAFGIAEFVCVTVMIGAPERAAEMFQRFGSVIVCVAVFFLAVSKVSIGYGEQHWRKVIERTYRETKIRNEESERRIAEQFGDDDEWVLQVKSENEDFLASLAPQRFEDDLHDLRVRWFLAEATILLFGTVQWGFGDLIINRIFGTGP